MIAPIAYMTADFVVRALPSRFTDALARTLARGAFALGVPARRQLEANLERLIAAASIHETTRDPAAWSRQARMRAREAFEQFALSVTDFLRLGHLDRAALPETVVVRGGEHLEAAMASGRGVIVLSAHVGNWEWGAAFLAGLGPRVHVAARAHPSPWVEAFYERRRRSWGVLRLCGRPLWLAASQALRRREWVAVMGDRPARGFKGSPCAWAVALARRTGAVVLPAVMLRLPSGRYAACFEPTLTAEECGRGAGREALRRCLRWDLGQWFAFEPVTDGLT